MTKWRKTALVLACALIALGLGLAAGQVQKWGFVEESIVCENGSVLHVPVFGGLGPVGDSRANAAIAAACDLPALVAHARSGGQAGLHFRTYAQGRVYRVELFAAQGSAVTQTVCHLDAATGRAYTLADLFTDPPAACAALAQAAAPILGEMPQGWPLCWALEANGLVCTYAGGTAFVPLEAVFAHMDLSGPFYRALLAKSLDEAPRFAL